ncbi:glycosyltransferase [Kribbella sp. DT2]|uniref:glycosyltransferase n=1 Tax=Kribbella sp. DT2 TaxID=3393427 RepID=UPI003CF2075D
MTADGPLDVGLGTGHERSRHGLGSVSGTLLQRTILPSPDDPENVRSMYFGASPNSSPSARVLDPHTLRVEGQGEVSFGTYFNAFPASYWRRWTTVTEIQLRLRVSGRGRIEVYRSDPRAQRTLVRSIPCPEGTSIDIAVTLDLEPFEAGGWYWFDVIPVDGEVMDVHDPRWYALAAPAIGADTVLGIPTMDRPEMCVRILETVADDTDLLATTLAVVVVDQGNEKVAAQPALAAVDRRLEGRLKLVDQPNLGGSGGFARVIHEALGTTADHIMLMDDDIVVEPESIHRAIAFARFARRPTLVGAQMLNLKNRSHLHSMGEIIDRHHFGWRKAPGTEYDHDLGRASFVGTEWLHRRIDVDYNGWWMCLIPRTTAETIGLPLPLFLKWDDAEYGLRAADHGHPTATVPGIAVWHMPWSDREQLAGWQTYFYVRNRLITAALHGPEQLPAELVRSSLRRTARHLLAMEYSSVALRLMAINDFLDGPERLSDDLPRVLRRVTACRDRYPDGRMVPRTDVPHPSPGLPAAATNDARPVGALATARRYASAFLHNARRPRPQHHEVPQLHLPADEAQWYRLSGLDGVSVSARGGSGVAFRKRDRRAFWSLLITGLRLHLALGRQFSKVRTRYRRAHSALGSRGEWARHFS